MFYIYFLLLFSLTLYLVFSEVTKESFKTLRFNFQDIICSTQLHTYFVSLPKRENENDLLSSVAVEPTVAFYFLFLVF